MVEDARRARPIRPRDAASLALVRVRGGVRQVLVGRRNDGHAFLPGLYVLPGGSVDAADARTRCSRELAGDVVAVLARRTRPSRARALAVAAVRETWEEAGLPVGEVDAERLVPDLGGVLYIARAITPTRLHTRFDARFFAVRFDARGERRPAASGELEDLRWIDTGRAVVDLPMLEVTRFVLAQVASLAEWRQPARVPLLCFRRGGRLLRHG